MAMNYFLLITRPLIGIGQNSFYIKYSLTMKKVLLLVLSIFLVGCSTKSNSTSESNSASNGNSSETSSESSSESTETLTSIDEDSASSLDSSLCESLDNSGTTISGEIPWF